MQALQGLPGYRGTENGIGIGLGLQQLAQARAQAQLNAHQAALAGTSLYSGHLRGLQTGFRGNPDLGEADQARSGIAQPPHAHYLLGTYCWSRWSNAF